MEEYTQEIVIAMVGAVVAIAQIKGNAKTAALDTLVESLIKRIEKLESEKIEDRKTIATLRAKLEEMHNRLYEALKGKKDSGIF